MISLGHNNYVPESNVEIIMRVDSRPLRNMISIFNDRGIFLEVRHGRKGKSIVLTSDGYLLMSSLTPKTIASRSKESFVSLGNNNFIPSAKISSVLPISSEPIKRKIKDARKHDLLFDVTFGKSTKTLIITQNNYYILSMLDSKTLNQRFEKEI